MAILSFPLESLERILLLARLMHLRLVFTLMVSATASTVASVMLFFDRFIVDKHSFSISFLNRALAPSSPIPHPLIIKVFILDEFTVSAIRFAPSSPRSDG